MKLKELHQSSGPARKATMLKRLLRYKMADDENVRDYLANFFQTTDKLREMDINIPQDLIALMLMNSLPPSFENFRCAIESRDVLPNLENLRVKIIEECEARKEGASDATSKALHVKRHGGKRRESSRKNERETKTAPQSDRKTKPDREKVKCFRCGKMGHFARDCKSQEKETGDANSAEPTNLCASFETQEANFTKAEFGWCLDSGCTTHMSNGQEDFEGPHDSQKGNVKLAGGGTVIPVQGKGRVNIVADVEGHARSIQIEDVLRVPDLHTNLLSVGKITDRGYRVTFDSTRATVTDNNNRVVLTAYRRGGLYYLRKNSGDRDPKANLANDADPMENVMRWHRRMGHLNIRDLIKCHEDKSAGRT